MDSVTVYALAESRANFHMFLFHSANAFTVFVCFFSFSFFGRKLCFSSIVSQPVILGALLIELTCRHAVRRLRVGMRVSVTFHM